MKLTIHTKYLKPTKATIYTNEPFGELVLKNRLRKAEDGNVEILTPFWNFKYKQENQDVVPPLLIYADFLRLSGAKSEGNTNRKQYPKDV